MDEDLVKKLMGLGDTAHGSNRPLSVLQNWLLQWPGAMEIAEQAL